VAGFAAAVPSGVGVALAITGGGINALVSQRASGCTIHLPKLTASMSQTGGRGHLCSPSSSCCECRHMLRSLALVCRRCDVCVTQGNAGDVRMWRRYYSCELVSSVETDTYYHAERCGHRCSYGYLDSTVFANIGDMSSEKLHFAGVGAFSFALFVVNFVVIFMMALCLFKVGLPSCWWLRPGARCSCMLHHPPQLTAEARETLGVPLALLEGTDASRC